MKYDTVR